MKAGSFSAATGAGALVAGPSDVTARMALDAVNDVLARGRDPKRLSLIHI
nr:hypothetical protein [Olsenella massiliensis]